MEMYIFALNLTCMEQINTIDKISAVYRNTAEEARQELNKVQQKIYRIGSLRLLLFVAGVVGIIYFWSESWGILACIALITLLPFLFLMKYHNRLFHRKDYLEKKMEINEQELAALDYDTSSFDDGEAYIDPTHLYTYDLDVFRIPFSSTSTVPAHSPGNTASPTGWGNISRERKKSSADKKPSVNWLRN